MCPQRSLMVLDYPQNIPMIDGEFDRFELNSDLSGSLHNADSATFYHDDCNPEE